MSTKVSDNLLRIKNDLPPHVCLVAVSKTHSVELIDQAYKAGQRVFGENKVQELTSKWEQLPKDIEWHYIGHLQTNKVKYMASFVSLIHGVDSLKLLQAIDKEAAKYNRTIRCLMQIHIAEEETKFGMDFEEATSFFRDKEYMSLHNIQICGLMGMATFTESKAQLEKEFSSLSKFFHQIRQEYFNESNNFNILSMGMSGDYQLAIAQGSNMVRIGGSIFGERNYL